MQIVQWLAKNTSIMLCQAKAHPGSWSVERWNKSVDRPQRVKFNRPLEPILGKYLIDNMALPAAKELANENLIAVDMHFPISRGVPVHT